jgi:hypothetical protein
MRHRDDQRADRGDHEHEYGRLGDVGRRAFGGAGEQVGEVGG